MRHELKLHQSLILAAEIMAPSDNLAGRGYIHWQGEGVEIQTSGEEGIMRKVIYMMENFRSLYSLQMDMLKLVDSSFFRYVPSFH